MSPSRRRSSRCWPSSSASAPWPWCSSPTTWERWRARGHSPKGAARARGGVLGLLFEAPPGSLHRRMGGGERGGGPLRVHARDLDRGARAAHLAAVLRRVGLSAELASHYPHEL